MNTSNEINFAVFNPETISGYKNLQAMGDHNAHVLQIAQRANAIARKYGYGRATEIVISDKNDIIDAIAPGWRKKTTGEYVPNSYLRKFGWKNTFYQHMECWISVKG